MDRSSDPYSALTSNDIQAAKQAAEASFPIVDWLTACLAFPDGVEFMRKGGAERTHAIQDVGIEFAQKCVNLGLIGVDYHMQDDILPGIRSCLENSSSVLITGETGTGKEVVARCIHTLGNRKEHAFKAINCGGMPSALIESELFGHIKGAFTGATANKKGWVESANGGTLFLDEIGDMPFDMQVKLLRFLNDGKYNKVGSTEEKTADVRVIAATNMNLEDDDQDRKFRSDLYYRLNTMQIHLWP